ncbi:MAG: asparagine synthase B [Bacillota bacterium]
MCGIAGGFGNPDREIIEEMLAMMRHRGPNDSGVYQSPGVVLGHNRLTIIDLNTGRQPLSNENGDLWLVYNGEIYNYRQLRSWLMDRGHCFKTNTDSEVLVHLYEEMGPRMVDHLDGMFAFALCQGGRFMLARDRLGIKPLYYGRDSGGTLYFASEIKALLGVCPDVKEFPNGNYYTHDQGLQPYFYLQPLEDAVEKDLQRAVNTLREKLKAAVKKRLVADVPVGVFLSGGLDSSLIAAMARESVEGELHSFAVGMAGCKDLEFSRVVARHLGTVHHTYEYQPGEVIEALPEVIYHLESYDPALVRSAIPTFFVSRLASRHVKVVLSGEGADELFAGYEYLRRPGCGDLNRELLTITSALHNTNLQRVDRMTMAHSIEGRVPFLDVDVVRYALRLSGELKLPPGRPVEKWVLRKVAESYLPQRVVWREKEKFAYGTGTSQVLSRWVETAFRGGKKMPGGSREEMLYRSIFRRHFPQAVADRLVGRTRSVVPGEIV